MPRPRKSTKTASVAQPEERRPRKSEVSGSTSDAGSIAPVIDPAMVEATRATIAAGFDAALVKLVNPPDLNGDDKPGGSLPMLAWQLAQVAWTACHEWAVVRGVEHTMPWDEVGPHGRLNLAIDAHRCMNDPAYVVQGFVEPWESAVRGKLFAGVVRVLAL